MWKNEKGSAGTKVFIVVLILLILVAGVLLAMKIFGTERINSCWKCCFK